MDTGSLVEKMIILISCVQIKAACFDSFFPKECLEMGNVILPFLYAYLVECHICCSKLMSRGIQS